MNKIRYCPVCKTYTLEEVCPCSEKSVIKAPPKYSPDNKMAVYRQKTRKELLQKEGLL